VASKDEPSVWLPSQEGFIEVNFIGLDRERPGETYVLEDSELPLLVFGHLSLLSQGDFVEVDGLRIPLPRPAGLLLEKLLTDRSGEKGDRDLLVALGLILACRGSDIAELLQIHSALVPELRHVVRANLTTLSLLQTRTGMPDPAPHRALVARLLSELERS
jgi:hypothetical protein